MKTSSIKMKIVRKKNLLANKILQKTSQKERYYINIIKRNDTTKDIADIKFIRENHGRLICVH